MEPIEREYLRAIKSLRYMAIKEQAYLIARNYEWDLMGGDIYEKE